MIPRSFKGMSTLALLKGWFFLLKRCLKNPVYFGVNGTEVIIFTSKYLSVFKFDTPLPIDRGQFLVSASKYLGKDLEYTPVIKDTGNCLIKNRGSWKFTITKETDPTEVGKFIGSVLEVNKS